MGRHCGVWLHPRLCRHQRPADWRARAGHPSAQIHQKGVGDVDIPVTFGGADLHPGDWLYADEDGVIVSAALLL